MEVENALLLGATGLVGSHLLPLLLTDARYQSVTVLTRKPLTINHPRLHQHILDFKKEGWQIPEGPFSVLFIAFGTTIAKAGSQEAFKQIDLDIPAEVAKQAKERGAQTCVLVSAVGADADSRIFYSRVKGQLEDTLRKLNFARLLCFRPSMLLGERQENRFGERIGILFAKGLRAIHPNLLGIYSGMPVSILAKAMCQATFHVPLGAHVFHYSETAHLAKTTTNSL